ncbi:hypothetical protein SAMN05444161_0258 [Rhizobiales bacterium GAS191]|nr:hypothetical protein SAMN05519103_07751 [Rhizobiales bacterium GAS113]SEB97705.1 hypothetical protein SAMN05444161_0258 [Rhizobiales bacterium GAS191]
MRDGTGAWDRRARFGEGRTQSFALQRVLAGLGPAIHALLPLAVGADANGRGGARSLKHGVGGRDKPGHDGTGPPPFPTPLP